MMADLLGTVWWSILCVFAGFGSGIFMADRVKSLLSRK